MPEKNEENVFLAVASLGAILGFIIPLIMWILKKSEFSDYTKKFLTDILNFELVLFIIVFALGFVPVLGHLASLILFIINLIIAIRCFSATQSRSEYSLPINVQLIK